MARERKPAEKKPRETKPGVTVGGFDNEALRRYVERVKSLHVERKAINTDISEVYEEAKEAGFVTKHIRAMVREQLMEPDVLRDQLAALDAMRRALGVFGETPLGAAAMAAASAATAPEGGAPAVH